MGDMDAGWTRRVATRWAGAVGALALATASSAYAETPTLPPEVRQALQRARVPESALAVVIEEAGSGRPLLSAQARESVNPASLAKLLTTYAALDQLGPAWAWRTPVWLDGPVRDGVLDGALVIQGRGDPTLVLERVWLLLQRVRQLGVREIRGDIVLDRGAFALPAHAPGAFDGEPLRPYNVGPDALPLNYKSVVYGFVPDPAGGRARVTQEPRLDGAPAVLEVPLGAGPCSDWRGALKASFGPEGARFAGAYPAACGPLNWPVADPDPDSYNARLLTALWRDMGGSLTGRVRDGTAPTDRAPDLEAVSPPLAEVVRDINKYSNNLMAQQLFLSLALAEGTPATPERARLAMAAWLTNRLGAELAAGVRLDNGAGLSRETRASAAALARLLQQAWGSPVMSELMSSLPVAGLDGTMRRSRAGDGRAHLKTGSLRDVAGVAGYVLSDSGRRYVLVAILNHDNAQAARPALDALVRWARADGAAR
ncbi:MAG: D-alanyl-D-alanine carboxypeptidase/D-alanyl-D-alanine-endopeptidase [Burkholderiaceae bacterium]|nr:D-alanyl-D-alanine carboxypeptidase/D-alanyl-D-alanine-endopeptidase [Burkholderiaceae bacterium]